MELINIYYQYGTTHIISLKHQIECYIFMLNATFHVIYYIFMFDILNIYVLQWVSMFETGYLCLILHIYV